MEICISGVWGTVCDDYWDSSDARVVCRQLGFHVDVPGSGMNVVWLEIVVVFNFAMVYLVISAHYSGYFGQGSGPIFLDDVGCGGYESSLLSCSHIGISVHNCGHSEDAGVVCPSCKLT